VGAINGNDVIIIIILRSVTRIIGILL